MTTKTALITGVTGQDGSYLSEFLLAKGYKVFGLIRRISTPNLNNLVDCLDNPNFSLIDGDLTDISSLLRALEKSNPDEVYNLAAMSYVGTSWQQPLLTYQVTGLGAINLFEAVRQFNKKIRIYQASSSELFGKVRETPQRESTPFYPRSPYGVAKLQAHWAAINYSESFDMFISPGILFNHESPRRGPEFVTRKVTLAVANILKGTQKSLHLGNLDSKRDWGFARDYMEAAYLMLQQDRPDSFVIATGETHSIKELCEIAFSYCHLEWQDYVESDASLIRPAEVDILLGDPSKAHGVLGWYPRTNFKNLIEMMVKSDCHSNGVYDAYCK